MASPSGEPGARPAVMVIERSRLKRFRVPASATSLSVTRLDSGTCAPLALLTWNCANDAGEMRCSRRLCGITS
ncbi:hypothetical protein G6F40_017786 [Rhizopus arrhizus]|nr:hypothetical protein G6F40_017786 [Rhizopus arrhizus]